MTYPDTQGGCQVLRTLSDVQRAEGGRTSNAVISSDDDVGSFLYDRFVHATPAVASRLNVWPTTSLTTRTFWRNPGLRFVVVFAGKGNPDGRIT